MRIGSRHLPQLLVLFTFMAAPPAVASTAVGDTTVISPATEHPISFIEVEQETASSASAIALELDEPLTVEAAKKAVTDLYGVALFEQDGTSMFATIAAGGLDFDSPTVPIPSDSDVSLPENPIEIDSYRDDVDGGGKYKNIYCNRSYTFSDSNVRFDVQRRCDLTVAPWGLRLQPNVRSICAGPASEAGMYWSRNGTTQPRQSPHVQPCDYIFHGRFNPTVRGDEVGYQNMFTFRHNVGPGGRARVTVSGNLWFRGR